MIRSCRDKDTENLLRRVPVRKFRAIENVARRRLRWLDAAANLHDLSLPGLRLEKLAGDRQGQYSIRVNDQYRICFEWKDHGALNVEITDYH